MAWRDRAGTGLLDPTGPDGQPIQASLDRRWLWRIEQSLAVNATNDSQRRLAADLYEYLGETCEHHWLDHGKETDVEADRQCLWCCRLDSVEGGDPDGC